MAVYHGKLLDGMCTTCFCALKQLKPLLADLATIYTILVAIVALRHGMISAV